MRKYFLILRSFYKNIIISAAFLLMITAIAELLLAYLAGTYRYYTRTDRLFEGMMHGNDAVCVSCFSLDGPDEAFYDTLDGMSAVKEIYRYEFCGNVTYNGRTVQLLLANAEMLRDYELLECDSFYSESGTENGLLQGIAVGDFTETKGEARDVSFGYGDGTVTVRIIGSIASPYYIPDLDVAATGLTSYDLIAPCGDTVIIKDSREVRELLGGSGFRISPKGLSFMILFNDCAESETQAVYDLLEENDLYYTDADTVAADSRKVTSDTLDRIMPLPVYLTLLSAILTFCFSILFLHSKMDLILTFYLCGCSKKRGYAIMISSLGAVGALATVMSIMILSADNGKTLMDLFNTEHFASDHTLYVLLICYWLFLLFLSAFASLLIYRRRSCAAVRRKVEL